MSEQDARDDTSFGFRTVAAADKARLVRDVFDSVAARYDLMNDLMSGGIHRLWKSAMIDWLMPRPGLRMIDVAGGTGDIAFRIRERLEAAGGAGDILVCDINERMLRVGRNRAVDRGYLDGLEWICADAESLPLPDASVEAYTIAFGIRNVTHVDRALREAFRVLKPGGRFLCLEFSRVEPPWLERVYDAYSFRIVPRIGAAVVGDAESYRYLVESIRRFPNQSRFAEMMTEAGFGHVKWRNLSGGIAAIHSAWRI